MQALRNIAFWLIIFLCVKSRYRNLLEYHIYLLYTLLCIYYSTIHLLYCNYITIFSALLHIIRINRSYRIVLSYIVIVPDFSNRDRFIEIIQRLPPAITPVATLANANVIVARYLFKRPLFPSPLPHSWGFRPAYGQKKSVGIEFPPSSRSKSRWSRHIGQCYNSVSFLHFFLCTLLSLTLLLSFFIFHLWYFQYDLLCEIQVVVRECQLFFTSITGDMRRLWGLMRSQCS